MEKMGRRYRWGWEKWCKAEEQREKSIRDAADGELKLTPSTAAFQVDEGMEGDSSATAGPTNGKRRASTMEETIEDLAALYADIPSSPEALHEAVESLKTDISERHKRRKLAFDQLVTVQAEAGTSGRMADYRRLIGTGCGVSPPEVDHVLGLLLEVNMTL